jgi:predicted DNA-binding transcriptional regulator AlpA
VADSEVLNVQATMITAQQLAGKMQISTRSLWRKLSAGLVPRPIRIDGIVRWRLAEVEQWIADGCPAQS